MSTKSWSEADVRALLAENDFRYQNIELPYGLSTGGIDRSPTARAIFPDDLTGKSVLDVGSKFGYFCFEALKRGAARAVGIDIEPDNVRKARLLADCLGSTAQFELIDIEREPLRESFDYVLCLNLLHHLHNPLSTLEKLTAATRERLILEVATLGWRDRRRSGVSALAAPILRRAPILFVSPTGATRKKSAQTFYLTPKAIDNLLVHQRKVFARVDILRSPHKGRFMAVAHKRRIGRLVVVAGPSSSGKTTFIERVMSGDAPAIADRIGLGDTASWKLIDANKLFQLTEPAVEKLIFHYDFLRRFAGAPVVYERDETLELLDTAQEVTFLTLWRPPELLHRQRHEAVIRPHTYFGRFWGNRKRLRLLQLYSDPAAVVRHYRQWFAYTRTKPGNHIVVSLADGIRLQTIEEWENALAAGLTAAP